MKRTALFLVRLDMAGHRGVGMRIGALGCGRGRRQSIG